MPNIIKNKRILDLSRIIVGPYASGVLAGFGCEVIKVQSPQGDPTRLWGPPWNNQTSTYFESVNCNKKSVCLNLKEQKCRQVLYKLVQKSDVVLQNFVPGVTEKLKIDYESLKKYNPQVIYCSVSGYGDIGHKKDYPAFDNIIQAQSGFMHLTGSKNQAFKMGFAITDVLTALYASNAILAGLVHNAQTGQGIHLKTSLYECAVASLINQASNYLNGNINPQRLGNHHPNIVPYGLYEAKDGGVVICVGTGKQYEGLIKSLGFHVNDEKLAHFKTNQMRVKRRKEFDEFLNGELQRFKAQQIIKLLDEHKVPCGRVNDLSQVFSSRLTQQLKMVEQINQTKMVRNPIRTHHQSDSQSYSNDIKLSSPPKTGQHTNEILSDLLNLSAEQIKIIEKLNLVK